MSGQKKGRGGGGGQGKGCSTGDNNEEIKQKLQEAIKAAQRTLQELNVEDGGKQKKPAPKKKQNTRGSQSMMDLSAGNKTKKRPAPKGPQSNLSKEGPEAIRPLMGHSPQMPGPNWNVPVNPYVSMNPPFGLYGNCPPSLLDISNAVPPPYSSTRQSSYGNNSQSHNYIPPIQAMNSFPGNCNVHPELLSSFGNIPPPPSYDQAVLDDKPSKSKAQKSKLTADTLVKALALFSGQFCTLETVSRQVQMDAESVCKFAKSRKDLFAMIGDGKNMVIELVPKVTMCPEYSTSIGCNAKNSCGKLHICKSYATEVCKVQSCIYGHKWDTSHNSAILSKLYLDLIDQKILQQVMRKVFKVSSNIQICNHYNNERGCRNGDNCRFLHICKSYVYGKGKCTQKSCSLNHNIVAQQCSKLLRSHGVPTNETPRDLLSLVAIPLQDPSSGVNNSDNTGKKVDTKREKKGKSQKAESSSSETNDSESSDDSDTLKVLPKSDKKKTNPRSKQKTLTVKSSDVLGNVEIPEICLFSIDDKCRNAKRGCKYLHAKSLFQWQFQRNGSWYNFRIFQSKILENAYRNVSKGDVQVPPLDQAKLEGQAKELLDILGPSPWKAEFKTMTAACKNMQMKIRRVSTQSSVVSSGPKATVYEWYFQDEQGKWIQYGQVDSLGRQNFVCSITSKDIEKKYLLDPTSFFLINSAHYTYKLDFSKMTQMNVETKKEREIRRRPSRLSYQTKEASVSDPNSAIPSHWSKMADNQTHLLVPLDASSAEYQDVSSRLRNTLPTAQIQKIQRLQNPYLWRLFQYKKAYLSQRYDDNQLNLQKLFHGTDPKNIDTICKENFDWRQGITVNQSYGQGTYFSNSGATARSHCIPDAFGRISVFLAQVIIGTIVKGDPSLTRPPSNPSMNALYDTTVDNVIAPTVFVKYDKEEYYPEYVLEFY